MGGEAASMAPSGWSVSIPSHSVSWWLPLDCRGWSTACGGGAASLVWHRASARQCARQVLHCMCHMATHVITLCADS